MTDPMTCGEARRVLWPEEGPRRVTGDVVRAQAHVAACAACRAFFDDMRMLADRMGNAAPRPEAPRGVRDRLFKAVAGARIAARAPRVRRRRWLWVAGAALVAAVGFGVRAQVLRHPAPEGAMAVFAEEHLRAMDGEGIATSDSLAAARWLAARLPMAIEVPLFPAATLKGGRLCLVGAERGAVLEYDVNGRTLSYFVVPWRGPPRPRVAGIPALHFSSRAGYRVVAWQDAGLTHALVADLPEARLADLARYCIHQMMAAIQRLERGMPDG